MIPRDTFKSRNGDTLAYLTGLKNEMGKRLSSVREKRQNAEFALRLLEKSEAKATTEKLGIDARITAWWLEYREVQKIPLGAVRKV